MTSSRPPAFVGRFARPALTRLAVQLRIVISTALLGGTLACTPMPRAVATPEPTMPDRARTIVLVSLDGVRWDYLDRGRTPTLDRLARRGVRAEGLVPVFPSKTFPNHYSLVTGLHPGHHGVVGNNMHDVERDAWFSLSNRRAVADARWWGGEPLWVALERAGRPTAPLFWPGSEAPVGGVRPRYWQPYDGEVGNEARGDRLLEWLALPPGERPVFLTLYMSEVDSAGHAHGPDSPAVDDALAAVDRALGHFVSGLERVGLLDEVDLIVVSDHGMASTPRERAIVLDDYLDLETVTVVDWSPVLMLRSRSGHDDEVYAALSGRHPHLAVYRRETLPERFHLREQPRVTPVVAIAGEGWTITSRARTARGWPAGNHGYDNQLESMRGIFLAHGPSFRRGLRVGTLEAVDVYALMADILGVPPAAHDGSLAAMAAVRSSRARTGTPR